MTSRQRNRTGEAWFDYLTAVLPDGRRFDWSWPEPGTPIHRIVYPPPIANDIARHELAKTATEELLIRETDEAANQYLKDRGCQPLTVALDHIHLLAADHPLLAQNGADGCCNVGRIYLARNDDPTGLLFALTHEVAHYIGFTTAAMRLTKDGSALKVTEIGLRHSGLGHQYVDRQGQTGFSFVALNEAITEVIANKIRQRLAARGTVNHLAAVDDLCCLAGNWESLELVQAICHSLSPDRLVRKQLWLTLQDDYLTGSHNFLKTLSACDRSAVAILRQLTNWPLDVIEVAEKLGLDEVAERIRQEHGL